MDFMDFSFSNSTYTALLALFAAIFGVGYPLIIQAIGEIDKKYDSTLHNEDLQNYEMASGDSVTVLITKADGFRYQILNHSS